MKKTYEEAEIEIIAICCGDIVTLSGGSDSERLDIDPINPVD